MEKDLTNKLYETYKYLETHEFEYETEKTWTEENIYNILDSITKEELESELKFVYEYADFIKKQIFYKFEYNEEDLLYDEKGNLIAFTPQDIYRLWLEKDISFYEVLDGCTNEYLDDVLKFWIACQYDCAAIEVLAHYKKLKAEIGDKK